jgi:superfamily II DNA/RNA helicase
MTDQTFQAFKLSTDLLKAIELLNFKSPTLVQKQVIPTLLEGKDMIVNSQTGSGKTAAFAIPLCQLVKWEENKPQVLVMAPTRELAIQVKEDFFNIGRYERLNVVALYGKSPFRPQAKDLKQKTHVVVGTPGRLMDHMEKGTMDVSQIKYLVIDEADEMLKMGFIDQVSWIIDRLPKGIVTVVLSATMPEDIQVICNRYLNKPVHIVVEEDNTALDRIVQGSYRVEEQEKITLLKEVLIVENPDSCMIFCNTQVQVDRVLKALAHLHFACDKIHGGMEQEDRLKVMNRFKTGQFRYLVATDVAARGIDVDAISLVINFDVPSQSENYVHRIGRTGRKGGEGKALTFVLPSDRKALKDIQEAIGRDIPHLTRPEKAEVSGATKDYTTKMNTAPEAKAAKGHAINQDIMKLHINAGKKTKMRAVDIVGTLCAIEGMTSADIGIITIQEISTYVEILNGKGEKVFKALQTMTIKGRERKVSKSV